MAQGRAGALAGSRSQKEEVDAGPEGTSLERKDDVTKAQRGILGIDRDIETGLAGALLGSL